MSYTKKTVIVGYQVKFYDLREPKPRTPQTEVFALEKEAVKSLGLLGLSVTDFIAGRYARGGYLVTAVERIQAARTVEIDLGKLWEAAAPAPGKENRQEC